MKRTIFSEITQMKYLMGLKESKQSESAGYAILQKNGIENAESIITTFAGGDKSKNQKHIPIMAFIYANWGQIPPNKFGGLH